jgi:hypothetical protein
MRTDFKLAMLLILLGSDQSSFAQSVPFPSGPLPDPPIEMNTPVPVTEQTAGIDQFSFIESRRPIGVFASTIDGDHEDAGFLTGGGGSFAGVVATHVIYTPDQFTLQFPIGAQGTQTLFAPTTRPPNGSCLEMGTSYMTTQGQPTIVSVYVFDFCGGLQFGKKLKVDTKFITNYTVVNSDGHREYTLGIATNATNVGQSANWNGSLYNYATKAWDLIYSRTGIYNDLRGWTIFETWYKKGQCSKSLPVIRASNLAYKDITSGRWVPVVQNMDHLTVNQHDGRNSDLTNTNCFHDDKTGPASYEFAVVVPDNSWQVTSTGH